MADTMDSYSAGDQSRPLGKFHFEAVEAEPTLRTALEGLRDEAANMATVWLITAILGASLLWGHFTFTCWLRCPLGLTVLVLALGRALPHLTTYRNMADTLATMDENDE